MGADARGNIEAVEGSPKGGCRKPRGLEEFVGPAGTGRLVSPTTGHWRYAPSGRTPKRLPRERKRHRENKQRIREHEQQKGGKRDNDRYIHIKIRCIWDSREVI